MAKNSKKKILDGIAPSKGLVIGKNKNNGFAFVKLHYTADPAKQSEEWKRKAKYGMEHKAWMTEMELSWQTYAGAPVYGSEFNEDLHVLDFRMDPNPEYPIILRGWDFGGNHSCAVGQYIRGTLFAIDEYPNMGFNTRRVAQMIHEDCQLKYGPNFRYIDIIDPSGMWEGKSSDGIACGDVMRELSLELVPGIQDVSRRIDSVMKLLTHMNNGLPKFQMNPECRFSIEGFKGGYHYPEKETQTQKQNKPVKNEYSHIHDCWQYMATRLDSVGDSFDFEVSVDDLQGFNYDL